MILKNALRTFESCHWLKNLDIYSKTMVGDTTKGQSQLPTLRPSGAPPPLMAIPNCILGPAGMAGGVFQPRKSPACHSHKARPNRPKGPGQEFPPPPSACPISSHVHVCGPFPLIQRCLQLKVLVSQLPHPRLPMVVSRTPVAH